MLRLAVQGNHDHVCMVVETVEELYIKFTRHKNKPLKAVTMTGHTTNRTTDKNDK